MGVTAVVPILPRAAVNQKRSLNQVQVFDGGPDGLASTTLNAVFARQRIFVP
jgi:hypothetical protein